MPDARRRPDLPGGRTFAFTIIDDTDVATVENVGPVYALLESLGMRTTKTVWPLPCPEGSHKFAGSETLADRHYCEFVLDLARRGFEIASHGATMESSTRERTIEGLRRLTELLGAPPRVYANHSYNRENLYWGVERLDDPLLRLLVRIATREQAGFYQGHRPGSPFWWGDLCAAHHTYVRNLTFNAADLRRVNPSMPYRDPRRPYGQWWFSASDAEDAPAFEALMDERNQDRLEADGGICIVATHLGKGYAHAGRVRPRTQALLERLAARPGWFVPVGELLDHLRSTRAPDDGGQLPRAEWRRMQWRWAADLVARKILARRDRARTAA